MILLVVMQVGRLNFVDNYAYQMSVNLIGNYASADSDLNW